MKNRILLAQFFITLIPLLYLLIYWNTLPDVLPIHYNLEFEADRFASKSVFLLLIVMLSAISMGCSLVLLNINKIDPKQSNLEISTTLIKISWASIIFLSIISCLIVYSAIMYVNDQNNALSGKLLTVVICLFFVVLGNFMNNIKPNYFVGIRTPWALSDAENWRKTHRLGAKLWFYGGIILLILCFPVSPKASMGILLIGLIPLILIPFAYSYSLFKKKQKA